MFVMNKVRGYGGQYREHSYDMFILKPSVGIHSGKKKPPLFYFV